MDKKYLDEVLKDTFCSVKVDKDGTPHVSIKNEKGETLVTYHGSKGEVNIPA